MNEPMIHMISMLLGTVEFHAEQLVSPPAGRLEGRKVVVFGIDILPDPVLADEARAGFLRRGGE